MAIEIKPSMDATVPPEGQTLKAPWQAPAVREIRVPDVTASNPQIGGDGLGFGSTDS